MTFHFFLKCLLKVHKSSSNSHIFSVSLISVIFIRFWFNFLFFISFICFKSLVHSFLHNMLVDFIKQSIKKNVQISDQCSNKAWRTPQLFTLGMDLITQGEFTEYTEVIAVLKGGGGAHQLSQTIS